MKPNQWISGRTAMAGYVVLYVVAVVVVVSAIAGNERVNAPVTLLTAGAALGVTIWQAVRRNDDPRVMNVLVLAYGIPILSTALRIGGFLPWVGFGLYAVGATILLVTGYRRITQAPEPTDPDPVTS